MGTVAGRMACVELALRVPGVTAENLIQIAHAIDSYQEHGVAEGPADTKPAPKATKAKPSPEKEAPAAEGKPDAPAETAATTTDAAKSDASDQSTTSGAADTIEWDGNVETLRNKCMELSQKAGTEVLRAALTEAGAAEGKWSQVPADAYGTLYVRIVDLLEQAN